MSDGEITFAKRGNHWTFWFKSSNETASLCDLPGWKNKNGESGQMDSDQNTVLGPIDKVTEATLDRFLEISGVSFVYTAYGFMSISFDWMPAPRDTENAVLDLIKELFEWDGGFSLEYYGSSSGSVSRLIPGRR